MKRAILLAAALASFAAPLCAHEVRPAYLALRQIAADSWDVLWKVPALGEDRRFGLDVELPATCADSAETAAFTAENAFTRRWKIRCSGPLAGKTISIAGLRATTTDVLVRIDRLDGSAQITRLTPAAPSFVVETAPDRSGVARTYTVLGIEHILTGIDHLLFVLALIIITGGGWKLAKTVTAFTVSHSVTLSLAALGYVHVPQRPVEACIALSIVFVAAEILRGSNGRPGIAARAPWLIALTFGLMHGLGFASGLSEAGLPVAHIPTALLFFSIGVETGHFLFIGVVLALVALGTRAAFDVRRRWQSLARPRWLPLVPPYAIGSVAMFWVIQRLAAF